MREVLVTWMMSLSQVLVLDPVCPWPGWRAAHVQWDMRDSSVSAAPLGTGERPQALDPTAPACLACAMGTARHVIPRQACAIAEITRQGLTVRSAAMGIMVMPRLAQPRTASPAHAQASQAVPLCPAPRRLCAPAARLALQERGVSCVMMPILETHWAKMVL